MKKTAANGGITAIVNGFGLMMVLIVTAIGMRDNFAIVQSLPAVGQAIALSKMDISSAERDLLLGAPINRAESYDAVLQLVDMGLATHNLTGADNDRLELTAKGKQVALKLRKQMTIE